MRILGHKHAPAYALACALGLTCAALASPAVADDYLPVIGGPGGGEFSARCPGDERLIGVAVRRGDDLDAIQILCADANGSRDPHVALRDQPRGGSGGRADNIVCAAKNPVVVGLWITFEGGDRQFVNDVGLSCGSPFGRPAGSAPGGPPGMEYCPTGQVAAGLVGRSGAMVDALGLICAAAASPPPAPRTPLTSNDRASATSVRLGPPLRVGTQASAVTTPVPVRDIGDSTTADGNAESQPPPTPPTPPRSNPPKSTSREEVMRVIERAISANRAQGAQDPPVDDGQRTGERPITGERVDGNRQDRIAPETRSGRQSLLTAERHGSMQDLLQPEHSLRVEVRYRAAYGVKDATGPGGSGPDSCTAFFVALRVASGVRAYQPFQIDTQAPMRRSGENYICSYLVSNLPFDEPLRVRVTMSDQRAAGSAVWQGGSQPAPPAGTRRTILMPDRDLTLSADLPHAAMKFEMVYSGSP